jgi:hypothetical protein
MAVDNHRRQVERLKRMMKTPPQLAALLPLMSGAGQNGEFADQLPSNL